MKSSRSERTQRGEITLEGCHIWTRSDSASARECAALQVQMLCKIPKWPDGQLRFFGCTA